MAMYDLQRYPWHKTPSFPWIGEVFDSSNFSMQNLRARAQITFTEKNQMKKNMDI